MATKWLIESVWSNKIIPVECVKETEKQAIILEKTWHGSLRERRMNKEGALFDSFLDAKNHLIELSKRKIASLQSQLDSEKAELKKRNDIPHPKQDKEK